MIYVFYRKTTGRVSQIQQPLFRRIVDVDTQEHTTEAKPLDFDEDDVWGAVEAEKSDFNLVENILYDYIVADGKIELDKIDQGVQEENLIPATE